MQLCDLKGLGKVRIEALRTAGIFSLRELLYYLPKGYKDTTHMTPIRDMVPYETVAIEGAFIKKPLLNRFKGLASVTGVFSDGTGQIACVWYNQPWLANSLKADEEMILYGKMEMRNGRKQMVNPSIEKARAIIPIYRPLPAMPSKTMGNMIRQALPHAEACLVETLPMGVRERHGLCDVLFAITASHFPDSSMSLQTARRRIAFERALLFQAGMTLLNAKAQSGIIIPKNERLKQAYLLSLGFEATGAQKRVLDEVLCDMADITPMSRLVQGDVGCGKTAIAFGALLVCAMAGYQGAMMAPTEILAAQHHESAQKAFAPFGIRVGLLTGGMPKAQRREALEKIKSGEWQIVFGTHALISADVIYRNIGLVVADEQHRFGVSQRTALIKKSGGTLPNVLVMSATPIPRTLALILYGDLDISIVDELPKGRIPVTTRMVPEKKREGLYAFVKDEVKKGRQAYIVCPLVEDSEEQEDKKAALSHYAALKKGALNGVRVGLTYGTQPSQEKNDVIDAFSKGEIDVLVSTTVIEVGVNVPNATVMIIEDAYQFGLSQLHQLRGRVGRGSEASWCFLLSEPNERLKTIVETNDGFVIAQKDLELRGPGELVGVRQHGHDMMVDFLRGSDAKLLEEVSQCLARLRSDKALAAELAIVEAHARNHVRDKLDHITFN